VQSEGEVTPCRDSFHEQVTPENTARKIADGFADSGALLVPRPSRTVYRIAKDGTHYSVSRLDGKTDTRYNGTWSADQIVRMFTADREAHS
jgi:hypothetical protein